MPDTTGRFWITYNGELYNFRALRDELAADGISFQTECDTEVVLAMYRRHGEAMLERLNGIFALAIWDSERLELFLARDRLGVKPLYYAQSDGVLFFASEVKALLCALPHPALRRDMLSRYLTFLWVPDPDTLFDGVYKLPPGHCARFSREGFSLTTYWDMTFRHEERPESEWRSLVGDTIRASIQRQMISDVPIGSFLSGGIDSSAIVAEMAAASEQVTTFTVGFTPRDLQYEIVPDDVQYARRVAQLFHTDYHEQILEPDIVELLPRIIWHMDEPVADPAAITTFLICSAARDRLKVVLSGMGGDEVFAGYPRHLAAQLGRAADLLPRPLLSGLRRLVSEYLTLGPPGRLRGPRRNLMKLARGLDASPLDRYLTYCSYYQPSELSRLLAPDIPSSDPFRQHRIYLDRVKGEHWLNQLLYLDAKTFLPCLNLTYTDKMSMAASTEVRVPLLDDELVSLATAIPPDLKLRRLTRKYIFKRSMEGTLPKEIIWRRKAGFGAPVRSWLVGDLKPMLHDLLSASTIRSRGLLNPHEVDRMIKATEEGTEDNAPRLWALLTLELWHQTFIDGGAGLRGA